MKPAWLHSLQMNMMAKWTTSCIRYDKNKLTAAHPSLPFGTEIFITNLGNKRKVEVRFQRTTKRIVESVLRRLSPRLLGDYGGV